MNGLTIMIGSLGRVCGDGKKGCKQTNYQTTIDILLTNGQLIRLFTPFLPIFLLVNYIRPI